MNSKEIVELLVDLINIDTTKSNGNETEAASLLASFFSKCGIENTIYEPVKRRGSIVARIPGKESDSILLHTHLDTADYNAENGESAAQALVSNNAVYGRGALDCKGNIAVISLLLKEIIISGITPKKTILFTAASGEESNEWFGTKWLLGNVSDFDSVRLAIGEGGGVPLPSGGQLFFTLQTGEADLNLAARTLSEEEKDTALNKALSCGFFSETTAAYLARQKEHKYRRFIPEEHFYKSISNSFTDGPGINRTNFISSLLDSVLMEYNRDWQVMPCVSPGYSDNTGLRQKGIETWGFFPLDPGNSVSGIHGKNEHISLASLNLAYNVLHKSLIRLAF